MRQGMDWRVAGAVALIVAVVVTGCGREEQTGYTEEGPVMRAESGDGDFAPFTVGMKGDEFGPRELVAPPSTIVTFLNNCSHVHTVTPDVNVPGAPNSAADFPEGIPPGASYEWLVPPPAQMGESWYYHCRFHGEPGEGTAIGSGMAGVVRAGPAVTELDGTGSTGDYRTGVNDPRPVLPQRDRVGTPDY